MKTEHITGVWPKYDLGIQYSKDKQGQINIPVSAYSSTAGFISGTNWKPISIMVNVNRTTDNNKFSYFIYGVVEGKVLGAIIYFQEKNTKEPY